MSVYYHPIGFVVRRGNRHEADEGLPQAMYLINDHVTSHKTPFIKR